MSNNISDIEPLNNSLNEIVQNYLSICSNFAIKKKDIESDELLKNEIILLQVSMNDLVIQLQNINFKINTIPHPENPAENISSNTDAKITTNTNALLDKTKSDGSLPMPMMISFLALFKSELITPSDGAPPLPARGARAARRARADRRRGEREARPALPRAARHGRGGGFSRSVAQEARRRALTLAARRRASCATC